MAKKARDVAILVSSSSHFDSARLFPPLLNYSAGNTMPRFSLIASLFYKNMAIRSRYRFMSGV